MATFSTEIFVKDLNGKSLIVTSPKTGNVIQIFQGWFSEISDELSAKIFGAWNERQIRVGQLARGNATARWALERENPCKVDLTVDDLKALHALFQKQQDTLRIRRNRR